MLTEPVCCIDTVNTEEPMLVHKVPFKIDYTQVYLERSSKLELVRRLFAEE